MAAGDFPPGADNMPKLDPNRIYRAIQEGVAEAIREGLKNTYQLRTAGDRIMDAVRDGTKEAIAEAIRNGELRVRTD